MARKYLVPIDLTKQELQNARIQNLASAPASPVAGQIYFNTSDNTLYFYSGTDWVAAKTNPYSYGSGASTNISITGTAADGTSTSLARADHSHGGPGFGNVVTETSYGQSSSNGDATTVARSNHTHGTPAHTDTEHAGIHLNALSGPTADVSFNSKKITSLADPSSAQDAATKNYVDGRKVTDLTAPTSAFSMNSQKITNLTTPTSDYDAANKLYVDQAVQGLSWKEAVHLFAASNIALSGSSGTLVIDSHSALDSGDNGYRLLLTGQSTGSQNGIYVYNDAGSGYTLTRATDGDAYEELVGATVFVQEGTLYGQTSWVQTNHYLTSFSSQSWVQFSGAGTYTASNGVVLDVKDFKFAPKTDGGLATGTSGGYVKLPTNSGLGTTSDGLAVGAGTGITVSGGTVALTNTSVTVNGNSVSLGGSTTVTANTTNALTAGTGLALDSGTTFNGSSAKTLNIDTTVVARKYSTALTGSATSYTVTHNLGTRDVTVSVRETGSPYAKVEPDIAMATTNTVTISFATAPTSDQYTVTVIG